eukprot:778728-Amphidinium_carterae.1
MRAPCTQWRESRQVHCPQTRNQSSSRHAHCSAKSPLKSRLPPLFDNVTMPKTAALTGSTMPSNARTLGEARQVRPKPLTEL